MLAYLFVVLAVLLRVTAGTGAFATYGFSLVGASLLFFGSRMPRKQFWIPAALLIGSDIYLNLRVYHLPLTTDQIVMWAWYLVPCFIGVLLRNRVKPMNVLGAGLGTGIGFYLTSNFAASHPSGLETETLTVLSICGTIHANLPNVTEVRFLVDGQQRPSLAGHADLTRTYLVADAETAEAAHP